MNTKHELPRLRIVQGGRANRADALRLESILPYLQRARQLPSGEWLACCPAHDDREPSLSLREQNGVLLWHCHAGCSQETVGEALRKLAGVGTAPTTATAPQFEGCTLQQLCEAKRLNPDLLRQWGVSDGRYRGVDAVRIPYYDEQGREVSVQWRVGLSGERFRRQGSPTLYGLQRLPEYSGQNLWVVEGVSDCWVLWHCGMPALGFPNNNPPEPLLQHFWGVATRFQNLFLLPDGDAEGQVLVRKLAETCPEPLRERVRVVRLPDGCKDASDLWLEVGGDADAFKQRLRECLERAQPLPEPQAQEPQAQAQEGDRAQGSDELVLQPVRLSELHNEPSDSLVPNLLYSNRITFLGGVPGVGKSVFSFELAATLSVGGLLWGKIPVPRARTLWLDFDDSIARLRDMILPYYELTPEQVDILCLPTESLYPLTERTFNAYVKLIQEYNCDLVVADTGFDLLAVVDGNDEGEARAKMDLVRELVRQTGVALLLLHHPAKHAEHTASSTTALAGSTRWSARADVVAYLLPDARDGVDAVKLRVVKNREGFKWETAFERRFYRFIPLSMSELPQTEWQIVKSLLERMGAAQYSDLLQELETHGRKVSERTLRAKVQRWQARGLLVTEQGGFPRRTLIRLAQVQLGSLSGSTPETLPILPDCDGLKKVEVGSQESSERHSQARSEAIAPYGRTDDGLAATCHSPCADSPQGQGDPELERQLALWSQAGDPFALESDELNALRTLWQAARQRGFPRLLLEEYNLLILEGRESWLLGIEALKGTPAVSLALQLLGVGATALAPTQPASHAEGEDASCAVVPHGIANQ